MNLPSPDFNTPALLLLLSGAILFLLRWPELGLHITLFLLYLNVPGIAVRIYGMPKPLAAASTALLLPALLKCTTSRTPRIVLDPPMLLMALFLGSLLLSSFAIRELPPARAWISDYLFEGMILYFLLLNTVQSLSILRRVMWVLLAAGAILSALSLYQEVTHSYSNTFGGLAQRAVEGDKVSVRAQGPVDDPNYYAQILIVLLPLAWARIRYERSRLKKIAAGVLTLTILGGIALTYSRGGLVAIAIMLMLMTALRSIKLYHTVAVAILFLFAAFAVAPGYSTRLFSIGAVRGIVDPSSRLEADAAARGRTAEMLAAWNVFRDHPVFGVGPGQFKEYSVDYMSESYSLKRIAVPRRGHSLYLELAAETGIVGLFTFILIIGVILRRLIRAWRHWRERDEEIAGIALAFMLSIAAYLASGIFLQLSFQRYYWLGLALAGAAARLIASHSGLESGLGAGFSASTGGPLASAKGLPPRITGPTLRL